MADDYSQFQNIFGVPRGSNPFEIGAPTLAQQILDARYLKRYQDDAKKARAKELKNYTSLMKPSSKLMMLGKNPIAAALVEQMPADLRSQWLAGGDKGGHKKRRRRITYRRRRYY